MRATVLFKEAVPSTLSRCISR